MTPKSEAVRWLGNGEERPLLLLPSYYILCCGWRLFYVPLINNESSWYTYLNTYIHFFALHYSLWVELYSSCISFVFPGQWSYCCWLHRSGNTQLFTAIPQHFLCIVLLSTNGWVEMSVIYDAMHFKTKRKSNKNERNYQKLKIIFHMLKFLNLRFRICL